MTPGTNNWHSGCLLIKNFYSVKRHNKDSEQSATNTWFICVQKRGCRDDGPEVTISCSTEFRSEHPQTNCTSSVHQAIQCTLLCSSSSDGGRDRSSIEACWLLAWHRKCELQAPGKPFLEGIGRGEYLTPLWPLNPCTGTYTHVHMSTHSHRYACK